MESNISQLMESNVTTDIFPEAGTWTGTPSGPLLTRFPSYVKDATFKIRSVGYKIVARNSLDILIIT